MSWGIDYRLMKKLIICWNNTLHKGKKGLNTVTKTQLVSHFCVFTKVTKESLWLHKPDSAYTQLDWIWLMVLKGRYFQLSFCHCAFSWMCVLLVACSQRYETWRRNAAVRVNSLACCPKSWRSFACRPQKWTWPDQASSATPACQFWPTGWGWLQREVSSWQRFTL